MLEAIKKLFQRQKFSMMEKELFKKHGVKIIVLFGSQISGYTHPGSDIDVGIVLTAPTKDILNIYADIENILRDYFGKKKVQIQLVGLDSAPLSLRHKAIETGKILYAESDLFLANYREQAMRDYFDFKPVEDYCNQVFLGENI